MQGFGLLRVTAAFALAAAASGCGERQDAAPRGVEISTANLVTVADATVRRDIGDDRRSFAVASARGLAADLRSGAVAAPRSARGNELLARLSRGEAPATRAARDRRDAPQQQADTLTLGFPVGMLGEQHIFGGVVTKVSAHEDENLGMLKLSDLPSLNVKTEVVGDDDSGYYLALVGCTESCGELSRQEAIVGFPIVGVSDAGDTLFVDVAAFGAETNLALLVDPTLSQAFTEVGSRTVAVDYSYSTLVFDVESVMRPIPADGEPQGEDVALTARWYLRSGSAANPSFVPRHGVREVGYFTTQRARDPLITRWGLTSPEGIAPVKYFFKTIPADLKETFAEALEQWNGIFEAELGKKLLSWEFVDADDARADALVAGDIRYNVIEWDLVNLAPYGGLGPSVANQATGELLSANTLVQGPMIVDIYKQWFDISAESRRLREAGDVEAADRLFAEGSRAIARRAKPRQDRPRIAIDLGPKLALRVPAQMPAYEDAAIRRQDFFETPAGETYETYMRGYWIDLLAHEIGHNLGLRHNFRGNLGHTELATGKVSRSIMEYLNRTARHKDTVGPYDRMAIAYGYRGAAPFRDDWFCTDEDVVGPESPQLSAECSRDDVSDDPFGWFETLFDRAVMHVTAPESTTTPTWTTTEATPEFYTAISGLTAYASSAPSSAHKWTNWRRAGRPGDAQGIRAYVLGRLKSKLCSSSLDAAVAIKATDDAKQTTQQNIAALRTFAGEVVTAFGLPAEGVTCD